MKTLYKITFILLLLIVFKNGYSLNDTTTSTINNFVIDGVDRFNFDIYTLRNTPGVIKMGNSSYFFTILPGHTLTNPVFTYVNPKYTVGSPTNSYDSMRVMMFGTNQDIIGVNIFYNGNGGDTISDDPGFNGLGEKIASVRLDILLPIQVTLSFNQVESNIIGTDLTNTLNNNYFGVYTGTLPVELSSFSCSVQRNNVKLNWVTASEINNHGFEIERKSEAENSEWKKLDFVNGYGNTNESKNYSFEDNLLAAGNYNYRLKQIDYNGNYEYFELTDEVVIGVPDKFELSQNFPNPFNPSTKINFSIPNDTKVSLQIFDITGKLVLTLIDNEYKSANYYTVSFNGANLSSGTYFYSLKTEANALTKKMILVK